jgi:uncharacterized protein with HEPN domain
MQPDARGYLWDIQAAAEAIGRFIVGLDAESHRRAELIRAAVERKLAIIGEPLCRLAKLDAELADRIPDFRESYRSAIY